MTESRTPDDPGQEPTAAEPSPSDPASTPAPDAAPSDSPTQPWPSLTPSMDTAPSAASWSSPAAAAPPPVPDPSTYEPTEPLPGTRLGTVAESGTFGASPAAVVVQDASRSRSGLRWGLALLGVLIVLGATALIVYLAGGRPATSLGMGYMPATTAQYAEVRLDLPGDQRPKLAAFLANFPGFKDQTQIEPKLNDVLDRIVRAASEGKQTYTTDIAPWFSGQISVGAGVPDPATAGGAVTPFTGMNDLDSMLVVIGIKDQAKAGSWLASLLPSGGTKETYNGADIWTASSPSSGGAVAITDKVMLLGSVAGVHAAIDSKGQGSLGNDADFKAAYAQVDKDYVVLSVIRIRPYVDAVTKMVERASPGVLSGTQLDETVLSMIPAWQLTMARFESDEFVSTTVYPSYAIGFDATNHKSTLLGHAPAGSLLYAEWHDVGQGLTAVLAKFRALPETKAAFQAFDQALNLLGGFNAVIGWWGDTAFLVTPGADGVIGGGLVIQPRDKAAADHLFTTLGAYLTLAGGSAGVSVRDEDHNGTKISILDFSAAPGMTPGSLPPGYKAEFAFAVTNDVAVLGYGRDFVASVLDAKPGSNLASDDRFKKLVTRVGEDNMGLAFLDVNAIRGLIEPIIQQTTPEAWTSYQSDIKPYLEHLDALISALRKDGGLDRGDGGLTLR